MRFTLTVLALAALAMGLVAAPVPKEKEKTKDEKFILGKWSTEKVDRDGAKAPGAGVQNRTYTFAKDGKLTIDIGGQEVTTDYKLDPSATPKTIDLIVKADAKNTMVIPGIYELDGDTLKICLCEKSKPVRPTEMKAVGPGVGVITFQRAKDAKEEKKDK